MVLLLGSSMSFVLFWRLDERRETDYADLPDECRSFRDLIRRTTELNRPRFAIGNPASRHTRETIWNALVEVVQEWSPKREIQPGSRIVGYLGID